MSRTEIVDGARDYRLMTRQMADAVLRVTEYNRFSKGIFSWVGFRTKWVETENVKRAAGDAKEDYRNIRTVFSIHNICFQGRWTKFSTGRKSFAYNKEFKKLLNKVQSVSEVESRKEKEIGRAHV